MSLDSVDRSRPPVAQHQEDINPVKPHIYVLIPVFNRLAHTREIIDCLYRQTNVTVKIVIVDDGSTDGTAEYLRNLPDVMTLRGDGDLWWAGAIHVALRAIHGQLKQGDFFAFMNNDTKINDDFLSVLASTSIANGRSVVGSVVRSATPPYSLLDIGPMGNLANRAIWDIARDLPEEEKANLKETYPVDFLPGRGTLYPAEVLDKIGYMRPRLLPHYHADYEFADRAKRAGFALLVASRAVTFSTDSFGNQRRFPSLWQRKFGKGSPENTLQKVAFFCLVGTPVERMLAIPRMLAAEVKRQIWRVKMLGLRAARKLIWLLPEPLQRWLLNSVRHRLQVLLRARSSSIARSHQLAFGERRRARRPEALHVYMAGSITELQQGKVLLQGDNAPRYAPFFKSLKVECTQQDQAPADLVFFADGAMVDPDATLPMAKPGAIIYVAALDTESEMSRLHELAGRFSDHGAFQLVANSSFNLAPSKKRVTAHKEQAHFLALKRLS